MQTIISVSLSGAAFIYGAAYNDSAVVNAFLADYNATDAVYQLLVEATATDSVSNEGQMRAAGFAEGYLTAELIQLHFDIVRQTLDLQRYQNASKARLKAMAGDADFGIFGAFIDGMASGYARRIQELNLTVKYTAADFLTILGAADYNEMYQLFDGAEYVLEQRGTAVVKRTANATFLGGVLASNYSTGGMRVLKTYSLRLYQQVKAKSQEQDQSQTQNNAGHQFKAADKEEHSFQQQVTFAAFPGLFGPLETVFQVFYEDGKGVTASYAAAAQRYLINNQSIFKQIAARNSAADGVFSQLRAMKALFFSRSMLDFAEQFQQQSNFAFAGGFILCQTNTAATEVIKNTETASNAASAQNLDITGLNVPSCERQEYYLNVSTKRALEIPSLGHALLQNAPFDSEVSAALNYSENALKDEFLAFNTTARFNTCAKFLDRVETKSELANFLQFNDYTTPGNLQNNDSCIAIAPRCDLSEPARQFGAVDFKIISLTEPYKLQFNCGATRGVNNLYLPYSAKQHENVFPGLHDVLPNAHSHYNCCIGNAANTLCGQCKNGFSQTSACVKCVRSAWLVGGKCQFVKSAQIGCAAAAVTVAAIIMFAAQIYDRKRRTQSLFQV